jgi:serine/threonine protein kinase
MAPELFNLEAIYDPRLADLWSLAIMYICMVAGRFPWSVACLYNPVFQAYATADGRALETSGCSPDDRVYPHPLSVASPEVRPLLRGMLRVQPSKRISVAMALEETSKWSLLQKDNWSGSTDTLV